jgi:hypothetical protein
MHILYRLIVKIISINILLILGILNHSQAATDTSIDSIDIEEIITTKPIETFTGGVYLKAVIADSSRQSNNSEELFKQPDFFIRYLYNDSDWSLELLYSNTNFSRAQPSLTYNNQYNFQESNIEISALYDFSYTQSSLWYIKGGINYGTRLQAHSNPTAKEADYMVTRSGTGYQLGIGYTTKATLFNHIVPLVFEYSNRTTAVSNSNYPTFSDHVLRFGVVYALSPISDNTVADIQPTHYNITDPEYITDPDSYLQQEADSYSTQQQSSTNKNTPEYNDEIEQKDTNRKGFWERVKGIFVDDDSDADEVEDLLDNDPLFQEDNLD